MSCVNEVIGKFCKGIEAVNIVEELSGYHTLVLELWRVTREQAKMMSEEKYKILEAEFLKIKCPTGNPPSSTDDEILRCKTAGDPLQLWSAMGSENCRKLLSDSYLAHPRLAPLSDELDSQENHVKGSSRAGATKLLYCYVNLRLLAKADKDIINMVEVTLEDALDEAEVIAAGATTETVVVE
eukprot:CAMPEP_0174893008 /NCGR_PEP_ID=MMETSP0167-20121228/7879_1 /TAXON_ID=38298 /ORGANISM="Rhodella maculata, Strain CCMP736" /LENGTH=182 /DNA_ID=CAMNT_0016131671 /DNA_START=686 /DNA_END=1235 /DNA_ORIENTATION=+